jgi:hypothetical protein
VEGDPEVDEQTFLSATIAQVARRRKVIGDIDGFASTASKWNRGCTESGC